MDSDNSPENTASEPRSGGTESNRATTRTLESRVTILEAQVAMLLRQRQSASKDWIQEMFPPVSDPEAFEEVVRLGREIREAERPKD